MQLFAGSIGVLRRNRSERMVAHFGAFPMSTQPARASAATAAPYGHAFEKSSTFGPSLSVLGVWLARSGQRKVLRELAHDRHLMRDIGLDPEQVLREAAKPFWRR
jgi:uncharacterized protein YjiS (DUF1127 family)